MEKLPLEYAQALYYRFASIYGDKFVKPYHNEKFLAVWCEEWMEGLAGIKPLIIKEAIGHIRLNLCWPPSIAEFRLICDQLSGVPSVEVALQEAHRQNFSHPVIAIAYEKVGSWALRHDKEDVIRQKFEKAYREALGEYRKLPSDAVIKLEEVKDRVCNNTIPSKVPSSQELIEMRSHLKNYKSFQNEKNITNFTSKQHAYEDSAN